MKSLEELRSEGFCGFTSVEALHIDLKLIPDEAGVYVILRDLSVAPSFLPEGTGGRFKGRNPNVSLDRLQSRWIDAAPVIYIGKAGGRESSSTLRSRLRQNFDFGTGRPVGHWGGRLIWQLTSARQLSVAWLSTKEVDPRSVERNLIEQFLNTYGALPFANLRR